MRLSARYIPQEEGSLDKSVESHRPGPFHRVVSLPRVFSAFCKMFSHPHKDLFATIANTKQPLYVSLVLVPMAWKQDASQHPWDNLSAYVLSRFSLLRQVLTRVMLLTNLGSSGGRTSHITSAVEPCGPTSRQEVSSRSGAP